MFHILKIEGKLPSANLSPCLTVLMVKLNNFMQQALITKKTKSFFAAFGTLGEQDQANVMHIIIVVIIMWPKKKC